ncbi:Mitochondrial import inner membrane translocase subunit TIM14-1 [Quillaja saponaria]|uniref:Mitochondrial import inner membrane translocase subunit TIM14-1 n=1 Tax=Quillaja saponaria TaxID=32244 RepID=A0AAD7Q5V7_QUISA|nr:Mitochondrial import inner membrane translocase subunit TIM14-1 [Quillaja saponaria]
MHAVNDSLQVIFADFEIGLKSKVLVIDCYMYKATPFWAGFAAALAGRYSIQVWQAFKAWPPKPRIHKFYDGGFQQQP